MKNDDIIPYHGNRIKQILRQEYNCRLENIWQGYKSNRRRGYVELYDLIDCETNTVIAHRITLQSLRILFTKQGYPLKQEQDNSERSKEAESFLKFVEVLKSKEK